MAITVGLLVTIIFNVIAKTSYFLQLLDLMQLVGACVYLEIQYPLFLEKFLKQMGTTLFLFMPKLVSPVPYTFSSSKYIFYNIDTSFSRTHLLTFFIFLIFLIFMITIILVDKYFGKLNGLASRFKYRNLNDLFSIFTFPLLLFSFSFSYSKVGDIFLGVIVILISVGWTGFISILIIKA